MPDVAVLVPWRPGDPDRDRHWAHLAPRWAELGRVVEGRSPDGPFNRAWAILDAAARADADVLVVVDADVDVDVTAAIERAGREGWAIPHRFVTRLTAEGTEAWYAGERPAKGSPLVEEYHRGNPTGTCVVVHRLALEEAPPDPRFVGWGQEDDAWQRALTTMVGQPWQGRDALYHLWHEPQPRANRVIGNRAGLDLRRRYESAARSRLLMRRLIGETTAERDRIRAGWVETVDPPME